MKNWLAAAGRFCLDFILLLALMSLSFVLMSPPAAHGSKQLWNSLWGECGKCFGPAVLASVFLASYAFERKLKKAWAVWLSLFLLGIAFSSGGEALRRLELIGQGRSPTPAATVSVPNETRTLVMEGSASPAERLAEQLPAFNSSLMGRLAGIDGLPLPLAAATLAGLLLMSLGLAAFARLPRWELLGFFFAAGGFVLAFILDAALTGTDAASIYASFAPRLGLGGMGKEVWAAGTEALLGLILLFSSTIAVGRREE